MSHRELSKLDALDTKVLHWIIANSPVSLQSWVYLKADEYKRRQQPVHIDTDKLYNEIMSLSLSSDSSE